VGDSDESQDRRNLTGRTFSGIAWSFVAAGAQSLLSVVALGILARLLSPTDFGIVSAAFVFVGFAQIFGQLGLSTAIVQRKELEAHHLDTCFSASLLLGVLSAGAVALLAPLISWVMAMEELSSFVAVLASFLLIKGFGATFEAVLQRKMRFRAIAWIRVVSYAIGYAVVSIVLAALGWEAWSLVFGLLAQAALTALLSAAAVGVVPFPYRLRLHRRAFRELSSFGAGISVAQVANYLALQGDYLVVGRLLGADPLGVYSRAYQLAAVPSNLFGRTVDSVLFPAMSKIQDESDRLRTVFKRGLSVTAVTVVPVSVFLAVLAPEIVDVVLGPQWSRVVPVFQALAVGIYFRTSYKLGAIVARAKGAVRALAIRQTIYATLVMVGAIIGAQWGIVGVAIFVLLAIVIDFWMLTRLAAQLSGVSARELGSAHIPALGWLLVCVPVVSSLAWVCRKAQLAPLFSITIAAAVIALPVLIVAAKRPAFFGDETKWFLEQVSSRIARRTSKTRTNG
jgi:PST family polysaccharide transporter